MSEPRWLKVQAELDGFLRLVSLSNDVLKIKQGSDKEWGSTWRDNAPERFPSKSRGVYLLYGTYQDAPDALLYVGVAMYTFDYRVWEHEPDIPNRRYIDFIAFPDKYAFLAPALEFFLISRLNPPHNSIYTGYSSYKLDDPHEDGEIDLVPLAQMKEMKMPDLKSRITVNPKQCGGRPCIRGMRIRVVDVLDLFAAGLSAEQILEELPDLEKADLQAALQYAARKIDYPVLTA